MTWAKPQEEPQPTEDPDVKITIDPMRFTLRMVGIATPDSKQSEAYVATSALFYLFSSSAKEEKVGLRLPPTWRDLWQELAEAKRSHAFAQDRAVVRELRALVQKRQDQELEDGVILQGAFRGRTAGKNQQEAGDGRGQDKAKQSNVNADIYRKIWADKSSSPKYLAMLVRWRSHASFWRGHH